MKYAIKPKASSLQAAQRLQARLSKEGAAK